jgi:hypothetical protein
VRRAAKRDANEADIVTALRAVGATVLQIDDTDAPDLLVGFRGVNYLLEVKRPAGKRGGISADGQRLSDGQEQWHARWRGFRPAVVTTPEQALAAIGCATVNQERAPDGKPATRITVEDIEP